MSDQDRVVRSWWKNILIGILAVAFGLCALVFPGGILLGSMLEIMFGGPKRSPDMAAVATLLALVVWAATDGLVHLFAPDVKDGRIARLRGLTGVAVAIVAMVWPGQTVYIAVELVGLWAILVGILELYIAKYARDNAKNRAPLIFSAVLSILIGVGIMIWAFWGAVVISATVGIAAMGRGVTLIMSGISERNQPDRELPAAA